jgi:orotidine-5'-phosphate decarboxylase
VASKLIIALDFNSKLTASEMVRLTRSHVGMFKVGLELFCALGATEVLEVLDGMPFFLDLKFRDIPTTVARAVDAVLPMGPEMLSVHADDPRVIEAVRRRLGSHHHGTKLLAVTVLTSSLSVARGNLPRDALSAGADGLICSPPAAYAYRKLFGKNIILVTPGVRPVGYASDDHAVPCTPREAVNYGADWIVVGRPITQARDPAAVAAEIVESMG